MSAGTRRLVKLSVVRFGPIDSPIDMCGQAAMASALRSDTPKQAQPVDHAGAPKATK